MDEYTSGIQNRDTNVHLVCRICLCSLENTTKISLFSQSDVDFLEYKTLLMECISSDVFEIDDLPDSICVTCATDLVKTYKFILKIHESYDKLQKKLLKGILLSSSSINWENDISNLESIKEEKYILTTDTDEVFSVFVSNKEDLTDAHETTKYFIPEEKEQKSFLKGDDDDEVFYVSETKEVDCFQCEFCNREFKRKFNFILHMRTHTNEKPFTCSLCEKKFISKVSLNTHVKRYHSESKEHTCETCGKQFFDKVSLIAHMRCHNKDKFLCRHCPKMFKCISYRTVHEKSHSQEKPHCCNVCGKTFVKKSYLAQHLKTHEEDKTYSCDLCGKKVKTMNGIKTHRLVHSKERPFSCELCGMSFAMNHGLKQHIRSHHESEKSGRCEICQRGFADLEEHLRVHTRERVYQCDLCKQKFITKIGLKHHIVKKHNETSKFQCSEDGCSETFAFKNMLNYHVLKYHTRQTPHVCLQCNSGFYRTCDLTRHLKAQHSNQEGVTFIKSEIIKDVQD